MTATDELRRMLDEAGVEWGNVRNDGSESDYLTEWQFDGIQSYAVAIEWAVGGGLSLETHRHHLTPAQAIAATVGRGTCHLEEIEKDCDTASEYMLDREWCFDAVYRCSCGCRFGHVAHNRPRFCPNCGAKVVDE